MQIGIIGAGVAGLVSAKYCLENGYDITVFEQSGYLGGTWQYTNDVFTDKYGSPVHSAMYKDLITNLPKEIMPLNGLEYNKKLKSYIKQTDILDYLMEYIKKFDIEKHVLLHNRVIHVEPIKGNKWEVTAIDCKHNIHRIFIFDVLLVCNGHYFKKIIPDVPGMKSFEGTQIHSKDFRSPTMFKGKTVLIIGGGPSGVDIAEHISDVADLVYISYKENSWKIPNKPNIICKMNLVVRMDKNKCYFEDGTSFEPHAIIYCTGYQYSFPFLSQECGISIDNGWIRHLYNHIINVEYPNMGFIGILSATSIFPMIDLMARYYLAYLTKRFILPSKEEMLKSVVNEQLKKELDGCPRHHAHKCENRGENYAKAIAKEASLKPIPDVIFKLHKYVSKDPNKSECYSIINDEEFVTIRCNRNNN